MLLSPCLRPGLLSGHCICHHQFMHHLQLTPQILQGIHLIQLQLLGARLTREGVLLRTQVHPREVAPHTQVRAGLLLMRRLLPEEPQLTGHQWEVLLNIQGRPRVLHILRTPVVHRLPHRTLPSSRLLPTPLKLPIHPDPRVKTRAWVE